MDTSMCESSKPLERRASASKKILNENREVESLAANGACVPISIVRNTLGDWLSKWRIKISLMAFSLLIAFNFLVLGTRPYHPLVPICLASVLGTSLVMFGLAIRTWAAGTLHKSQEVTTVGPYALVRNPLYVGSFFMMFGFCTLMKDWLAMAFVIGPITVLYWYQVRVEERNLSNRFHDEWHQYFGTTGRFLPRSISRSVLAYWSFRQWLKNREYQAVIATLIALAALGFLAAN